MESRRVDNQARGRSGRQGDLGKTRFFLSLQDELMRIFGSNNILNQTAKKKGIPLFTQGFTNEILGSKGFSGDTSRFTNTLLDNVYKTTIYNFNPKVRKQLTKEITNVLSGGPAKVTEEARTKIKNNP